MTWKLDPNYKNFHSLKLAVALCLSYLVFQSVKHWGGESASTTFLNILSLNSNFYSMGYLWQIITFPFIYSSLYELQYSVLFILVLGYFIECAYGGKRLLLIFFAGNFIRGIVFLIWLKMFKGEFSESTPSMLIGLGRCHGLVTMYLLSREGPKLFWWITIIGLSVVSYSLLDTIITLTPAIDSMGRFEWFIFDLVLVFPLVCCLNYFFYSRFELSRLTRPKNMAFWIK